MFLIIVSPHTDTGRNVHYDKIYPEQLFLGNLLSIILEQSSKNWQYFIDLRQLSSEVIQ